VMGDFYGKRRFVCEMFTCFTIKNEKSLRLTRTLQVSRQSDKKASSISIELAFLCLHLMKSIIGHGC
ncbi:hypothetical protein, partial [Priestia flexa]|uniref:hypothetical protein n=1 Tax=Priestia flexa TaxID=86664 RepID=UPI001A901A51